MRYSFGFNTQPPEDGDNVFVSTHSRPKAAGTSCSIVLAAASVSTHSRPKAAGMEMKEPKFSISVSTHSRPKAAGTVSTTLFSNSRCFNTQPPEGGWSAAKENSFAICSFQHTAARRRLGNGDYQQVEYILFQHTAARRRLVKVRLYLLGY